MVAVTRKVRLSRQTVASLGVRSGRTLDDNGVVMTVDDSLFCSVCDGQCGSISSVTCPVTSAECTYPVCV